MSKIEKRQANESASTQGRAADAAALPAIHSFKGVPDPNSEGAAPTDSIQVEAGTAVVLRWEVDEGASVELTDPAVPGAQTFPAGTTTAKVTLADGAAEIDYVLVACSSAGRSEPRAVHVSTHEAGEVVSAHAAVARTNTAVQLTAALDVEGAEPGASIASGAQETIELRWKATQAATARLVAVAAESEDVLEGMTDADGWLRLNLADPNQSTVTLRMFDGDTERERWVFGLDSSFTGGAHPDPGSNTPRLDFATLLTDGFDLDPGAGEGVVLLQPGPGRSATVSLLVPVLGGGDPLRADVTLSVSNFHVQLFLHDGTQAPEGMRCTLEYGDTASDAAEPDTSGEAAA